MAQIKNLKNRNGEKFFPVTSTKGVFDEHGHDLDTLLDGKVDKVEGKQLTTNDYTNTDKNKLDALPTNELLTQTFAGKQDAGTALRKTEQALTDEERAQVMDNLGRPDLKSFIDQWNQACGKYGSYDPTNAPDTEHPFYLNELWLTYEEAIEIMSINGNWKRQITILSHAFMNLTVRTLFPIKSDVASNIDYLAYGSANLEAIAFDGIGIIIAPSNCYNTFYNCKKLRKISGIISCFRKPTFFSLFKACESLEEITIYFLCSNLSFEDSPRLSLGSINTLISRRDGSNPITITVHPDVYAKLTDESNTEWHALLVQAAEKNITFATN